MIKGEEEEKTTLVQQPAPLIPEYWNVSSVLEAGCQ